ncbi:MAG: hypothetical protein ACRCS8_05540 [Brevinema sp.]
MKKIMIMSVFVLSMTDLHAALGRHNLQLNFGGGYHIGVGSEFSDGRSTEFPEVAPVSLFHGGIVAVEMGYVFHNVQFGGMIHGLNLIGEMNVDLSKALYSANDTTKANLSRIRITGGLTLGYVVGRELEGDRFLFELIGLGLKGGYAQMDQMFTDSSGTTINSLKRGNFLAAQIAIGSLQYIKPNGFTFGWRNKFSMPVYGTYHSSEPFIVWDSYLTMGVTIGK